VQDGQVLGVVSLSDVRSVPHDAWERTPVGHIMTAVDPLELDEADGATALRKLADGSVDQIPVLEHGHFEGVVRRADILKWLALRNAERT
jgi:CBS domain-containing protein